jgi:hypothetical protein
MSKMQALLYLIVALAGFAAMSYCFYKLMVAIFTHRFKGK